MGKEGVAVELGEHVGNLLGWQNFKFLGLNLGRRMNGSDVAGEGAVLDSID